MEHKDVFLLETILEHCDKISSYLHDNNVSKEVFLSNPYFQDTCAFYCLQIGENANSLSEQFVQSHPEIEWRNIINLRHIIAHEYGAIDTSLLWDILYKNIPELREFCIKTIK